MPKSKSAIPDRWENYTNIGGVIEGTQFITFKVPLKETIQVRAALRFTPRILLESLESNELHLGLLIDLTNTTRYYNSAEFEKNDISYNKIFVPGHVIPSDDIFKRFAQAVDTFLDNKEREGHLVGVHCTHGVNRTGYMVCRYMIEKLGIDPNKAIEAYGAARGYPIERENYLEDLRKRIAGQTTKGLSTDAENPSQASHHNNNNNFSGRNNWRQPQGNHVLPGNNRQGGYHDNNYQGRRGHHNGNPNHMGYSGYRGNNHRQGNDQSHSRKRHIRYDDDGDGNYYESEFQSSDFSYHNGYQQSYNYPPSRYPPGAKNYYPRHNNPWQQHDYQPKQQYSGSKDQNPRKHSGRGRRRPSYGRQNSDRY